MPETEHIITSTVEKWRYVCPTSREHTNWFPINGHFRCKGCADLRSAGASDVDPEHDHLRDQTTGELIPRDEITLAIDQNRPARA